jgi:hypothetical protein
MDTNSNLAAESDEERWEDFFGEFSIIFGSNNKFLQIEPAIIEN